MFKEVEKQLIWTTRVWKKKNKERKTSINFKFSSKSKGGQNNKVLEKLRNQKKGVNVN